MKNYLLILIASATVLFSCNGKLKQLKEENERLAQEGVTQDSLLNHFMTSFNDFEANLEQIKARENLITMQSGDPEMRKDTKGKILDDLQAISDLMDKNRGIIDDLNEKIKNSEIKNKQFRNMIARLNKQMKERDASIEELKGQLADANFKVEELAVRVSDLNSRAEALSTDNELKAARLSAQDSTLSSQQELIEQQVERLNTAYYVAGTAKELKDKNVVVSRKQVNGDFDPSAFTQIDITQTESIPFDARKARILTHHPSSSYELVDTDEDKHIDQIAIRNPETFWKQSKYLVVVLK